MPGRMSASGIVGTEVWAVETLLCVAATSPTRSASVILMERCEAFHAPALASKSWRWRGRQRARTGSALGGAGGRVELIELGLDRLPLLGVRHGTDLVVDAGPL